MWCTTSLTFNNCTLCPHCICVFRIYLRTNSDLCHLQHKLIGFYSRDEKCLQRVTDWVFKYSSLRFVFKWLMYCTITRILQKSDVYLSKFKGIWRHSFTIFFLSRARIRDIIQTYNLTSSYAGIICPVPPKKCNQILNKTHYITIQL